MIKLVIFQLVTVLSLGLSLILNANAQSAEIIYWSDLGTVEQIRLITGLNFIAGIALAAIFIFRSIWIREGYSGLDKILVDKEVALFMSHVLAFMLLEVFFFMILFYRYTQPPEYAFWICGAGFLSPEVVQIMHFVVDRLKSIKKVKE